MYYISLSRTYFFLNPHSHRLGHVLALATQKCLCLDPGSFVMILDGFGALLFVPPALEVLAAEIKATIQHWLLLSHSPIRAFTQCHLKQG